MSQSGSNKFLLNLVNSLTHKQIFFLVWAGIALGFVLLLISYYRKTQRRNFREGGPREAKGNALVPRGSQNSAIVPKSSGTHIQKK